MFEHHPFPKARPYAEETIKQIAAAFKKNGKRFVLVEAATGSGKSALAVTVARALKAPILTPTKVLQEQYANTPEFDREYTIKGKSNYQCGLKHLGHMTVEQAVCCSDAVTDNSRELIEFSLPKEPANLARILKTKCAAAGICPYYTKVYQIEKVPGAVPNYDLFFRLKKYPNTTWGVDMGSVLVMDEAHQLLTKIRENFSFKYSSVLAVKLLGKKAARSPAEPPKEWLLRLEAAASKKLKDETDPKRAVQYDSFVKRVNTILAEDIENERRFYIDDRVAELEIKPLDIRFLKEKIFYPFQKILLLSATFPSNFKELLGITDAESETIIVPSVFSVAQRPTLVLEDLPILNKDTVLAKNSPAIQVLDLILDRHAKDKGIIHTGNYKFLEQLQGLYRKDKRFLWVGRGDNKEERLAQHASSKKPTILVSPSMMEGVDLKDDLARFGVLLKVPFPALDEYAQRMKRIFPSWYNSVTALAICQAYGRQVRSETDWAKFYILDGMFLNLMSRSVRSFSPYFAESVQVTTTEALRAQPG